MQHELFGITFHSLGLFMLMVAVFYLAIIAFTLADLWSGIRKAKQAGHYCSSRGLRDTVNKLARYFNLVVMFTLVDMVIVFAISCLGWPWPHFPFCTLIATCGCAFIEIKSVFEKMEDKQRARVEEAAKALIQLSKEKDVNSLLETIVELSEKKNSHEDPSISQ